MDEISKLIESAVPVDVQLRLRNAANSRDFWQGQACIWRDKYYAAHQCNWIAFCVIVMLLMAVAGLLWEKA